MCTASPCDLEEIPLDDEDSDSLEFKILEFYVKHHVFQNTSAVLSPKHLRTRSLSQKGPERWPVNEAWTQGPWPCVNSQSSEKAINLTKKKSSWRTLFGVAEKEEDSQSSPPEICPQVQRLGVPQARPRSPKWPRSRSSVDQRLEHKAADPRVVSIANRVAEIVYSWPPPEELHSQGGGFKSKGVPVLQGLQGQSGAESTKKVDDEGPSWLLSLQHIEPQGRRFSNHGGALQPQNQTGDLGLRLPTLLPFTQPRGMTFLASPPLLLWDTHEDFMTSETMPQGKHAVPSVTGSSLFGFNAIAMTVFLILFPC
ncbi:apoptosis facilitator Bcl-2-like protein 14 isoform X6 [Bubalus kerabau]|uniref:apoptosis facilitator Bcl-2-like protein 14 isoform X5 n=1 Tax=Bubalus bubalis TaxID=89462 RepID=UPI001D11BDC5|nr:apoptosis facilitator Bcl-2-like protein 14 isoform X5 [Bubalus bubalis]XP_055426384.1 apoptosis facilitator Bcl-2-like protein 14 isoform X6 [Bubalus carabanensis]